jgi:hypothetical protein
MTINVSEKKSNILFVKHRKKYVVIGLTVHTSNVKSLEYSYFKTKV